MLQTVLKEWSMYNQGGVLVVICRGPLEDKEEVTFKARARHVQAESQRGLGAVSNLRLLAGCYAAVDDPPSYDQRASSRRPTFVLLTIKVEAITSITTTSWNKCLYKHLISPSVTLLSTPTSPPPQPCVSSLVA